jgi:hypothetical protein
MTDTVTGEMYNNVIFKETLNVSDHVVRCQTGHKSTPVFILSIFKLFIPNIFGALYRQIRKTFALLTSEKIFFPH